MKYAATYRSRKGKAIIHIVAPPPMSGEQKARLLADFYAAAWAGWNALSVDERQKINAEFAEEHPDKS